MYTITQRLYLTEDSQAVPENHSDGRWLYATPGKRITIEEAARVGLLNRDRPDPEPATAAPGETGDVQIPSSTRCDVCGFTAKTVAGLQAHQRSKHTQETP